MTTKPTKKGTTRKTESKQPAVETIPPKIYNCVVSGHDTRYLPPIDEERHDGTLHRHGFLTPTVIVEVAEGRRPHLWVPFRDADHSHKYKGDDVFDEEHRATIEEKMREEFPTGIPVLVKETKDGNRTNYEIEKI